MATTCFHRAIVALFFLAAPMMADFATSYGPFGLRFVAIPPSEFTMGCSPGDPECSPDERPSRLARITKPFEMGKVEVTQAQFAAVMGFNPSYFTDPDRPVETVSWDAAQAFLKKLNGRNDGYRYRIPSEAEWEYGARAGTTGRYGGGLLAEVAWYSGNSDYRTHPVGLKKPNARGLHGLLGNVWEWVSDWHGSYPEAGETDPVGPGSGAARVMRGGSWAIDVFNSGPSVSGRNLREPHLTSSFWGFRCLREAIPGKAPAVALSSLTLSERFVASGGAVPGTIRLTAPAPPEGAVVALESSAPPVVMVPAGVTVPAGQTAAVFSITAASVSRNQEVTITARFGEDASSVSLLASLAGAGSKGPYGIQFVSVLPGEFLLGCSPGASCYWYERPPHLVRITRAFEIGKYEVTQEQWEAVMGANPSVGKGPGLPVERVSWYGVQDFLTRLNALNDGYRYRLPTEAEWEYAARAGTVEHIPGGNLDAIAWFANNAGDTTHEVGQKEGNAWGMFDVLGNVQEWVQDWYLPFTDREETDPSGPDFGAEKVLRGGGIMSSQYSLGISYRNGSATPFTTSFDVGFRCVREVFSGSPNLVALSGLTVAAPSVAAGGILGGTVRLAVASPSGGTVVVLESTDPMAATVPESVTVPAGSAVAAFTVSARVVTSERAAGVIAKLGSESRVARFLVTLPSPGAASAPPFGIRFTAVQPGAFTMGCSLGDSDCAAERNQNPRHLVKITRTFELGTYEVTQAQWEAAMGSNPSATTMLGSDLPVQRVSWPEVQTFLTKLNQRNDGYRYRLPTEAEWEYAARAGATDKYAGGVLDEVAWHAGNSGDRLHSVGQKKPNAWGLYDMLGNAAEWVGDWYGSYSSSETSDPLGPKTGEQKIWRGGSFQAAPRYSYTSARYPVSTGSSGYSTGFRCARELASADGIAALELAAPVVASGEAAALTVSLRLTASPGGTLVILESGDPAAVIAPAAVTVREGQTMEVFAVQAKSVTTDRQVEITARLGEVSKTVTLTVTPPVPAGGSIPNPASLRFISISNGEFTMGCSPGDSECSSSESPRRRVRITKPFEITSHEVTQAQWAAHMGTNPSLYVGPEFPVTLVSHNDIQEFLFRLNERNDGYRYRLPAEAEWEYAARAGAEDKYGGRALSDVAWYLANSENVPHPVGLKGHNGWGLYDMLGNVAEVVEDWYGNYPATDENDPAGQSFGVAKVTRGGAFGSGAGEARVSSRSVRSPGDRVPSVGFRIVRQK